MSLHSQERLTSLRLTGRRSEVSSSQWRHFNLLHEIGLGGDPPVGGFPLVRGQSGCVFRWGEGWFAEIRERVGWDIARNDKPEISTRVDLLLRLFRRSRVARAIEPLCHAPLAIEDG